MKTFLVTGNFDGEIQDFFHIFLGGGGGARTCVERGRRGDESFSFASGERGSGYMRFIIQMTHMELIEPLECKGLQI